MTDTPKPPMVVWLTGKQLPCEAVGRHHSIWAEQGPYVHLDQFLAEVERRAKGISQQWNINIVEARGEALRLLADDLRRGKQ